ncbi:MAG: hypothetical protein AAF633_00145 [Chloroflexota bacterium]
MKKQFLTRTLLLTTATILAVLTACSPQVVEVEVTRIVEVEVEVEVETEVIVEVEITREVDVIIEEEVVVEEAVEEAMEEAPEEAQEVLGDQTDEAMMEEAADAEAETSAADEDPIEAVGSEEDDGSPFIPTSGQKNGRNADKAEVISWLTSADDSIEEPTARVLANHVGNMMIIHTTRTSTFEEKVILARSIILYERKLIDETSGESLEIDTETLYLPLSINRWNPIVEALELNTLPTLTDAVLCEICAPDAGEILAIITPEETLTLEFDLDQETPDFETLLFLIRDLQTESRVRVRSTLDELE